MFGSLAWPLILGLAATAGFFWLVFNGPLAHPLVRRYFAGHPIKMVETAVFFIGLVALLIKLLDLVGQFGSLRAITLGEHGANEPVSKAAEWLDALAQLSSRLRQSYLGRRLSEALDGIVQRSS